MTTDWIKSAMLRVVALVLFCALFFAPVAISVTHGPEAVASAIKADAAKAPHGDFLVHLLDWDELAKSGQHDATDHEHNFAAVWFGRDMTGFDLKSAARAGQPGCPTSLSRDGPRRPPRACIV